MLQQTEPGSVRYWWVNHKKTHRQELEGEFLWSPKRQQSSANNESSNNMTKIMPGDVVFAFSFTEGLIRPSASHWGARGKRRTRSNSALIASSRIASGLACSGAVR